MNNAPQEQSSPDEQPPVEKLSKPMTVHRSSRPLTIARAPRWIISRPWLVRILIALTGVRVSTKIMGIVVALTLLFGIAAMLEVRNIVNKTIAIVLIERGTLEPIPITIFITQLSDVLKDVTEQMMFTTIVVAGLGIEAAILATWLITRPIVDLVTATESVRHGDLTTRAPRWTDDEIGVLSDAFNTMVSELAITQQKLLAKESARTHLLSRLINAQEDERKRIARELHDEVGQALTSILVHIKVLAQSQDPDTQALMDELSRLINSTLTEIRLMSRELRPSALDDLGLAAALERYEEEFKIRYPDLAIDIHCALSQRLTTNVETSLYRIIQEAMTNTARHSHATTLSVVVSERAGAVQAVIEDNGVGFDVESVRRGGSGVGLHSMTERSELLNGKLDIESSEQGTTIFATIPLGESDKLPQQDAERQI